MDNINFKIRPEVAEELDKRALESKDKSRHLFARRIVEQYLQDNSLEQIKDSLGQIEFSLGELKVEIKSLRDDLANAILALLSDADEIETIEEAREWLYNNFYN